MEGNRRLSVTLRTHYPSSGLFAIILDGAHFESEVDSGVIIPYVTAITLAARLIHQSTDVYIEHVRFGGVTSIMAAGCSDDDIATMNGTRVKFADADFWFRKMNSEILTVKHELEQIDELRQ